MFAQPAVGSATHELSSSSRHHAFLLDFRTGPALAFPTELKDLFSLALAETGFALLPGLLLLPPPLLPPPPPPLLLLLSASIVDSVVADFRFILSIADRAAVFALRHLWPTEFGSPIISTWHAIEKGE
jgi:hypothetical protein